MKEIKCGLSVNSPVEMAITGSDLAKVEHPGYYVDTRDASDRTLARVPARNAFSASVEVFPQRPGEPISRVDVPQQRGAFTVVVPVPENADYFSVVQITPGRPDTQAPASRTTSPVEGGTQITEPGRFPLTANLWGRATVSTSDGAVIGTTQIFGNAPRNRAFNIVLLAEGFTNAQQNDFNNACTAFVNCVPDHAAVR